MNFYRGTVKTLLTSLLWRGFLLPSGVGGSPLSLAQSVGVKMRGVGAPPRFGGLPRGECEGLFGFIFSN
jgi:hypothetical protein